MEVIMETSSDTPWLQCSAIPAHLRCYSSLRLSAQRTVPVCGEQKAVLSRMLKTLGTRIARPLLWKVDDLAFLTQLRGVKVDTGIVGLKVVPNAREVLREKLTDVLRAVSEQIPEQAEYRKAVESTMQFR